MTDHAREATRADLPQLNERPPGAADLTDAADRLLDLIEALDVERISDLLDEDVAWLLPMSMSGYPEDALHLEGREAFLNRLQELAEITSSVRFAERRISVTHDEITTFVQALGDFMTSAGAPYRNTYVFRFDWRQGKLVRWEEYANPVAVQLAYPGFD
jgi:ketosteroid isomerase-like protein